MQLTDRILGRLLDLKNGYSVCGIVDRKARVHPLGSDTKVISTIFEILARSAVYSCAEEAGLSVKEPDRQNHYPDFTLMRSTDSVRKIALDVKTTYRKGVGSSLRYTLGSYTSYIRPASESKNIVYPHSHYGEHWVIGFVYSRSNKGVDTGIYSIRELQDIEPPFRDVDVFVQEKWRIASDRAGSGNTASIGSISGKLEDFVRGNGPFVSEAEFLAYWRGYEPTEERRKRKYSNLTEFRERNGTGT